MREYVWEKLVARQEAHSNPYEARLQEDSGQAQ